MFPPRTTGCEASAARMAAVSADVVVLPFVPVMPTVVAGHSRRKRSGSLTSGGAPRSPAAAAATIGAMAARRAVSAVGYAGLAEGEKQTRAAPRTAAAGSTPGPSSRVI